MFDLDQAISEWRRQMAAGGIKMPDALEELESHLREDVDHQVSSGLSQQEAFYSAVQRIGESKALKGEFRKVNRHRAWGFLNNPLALNLLAGWLFLGALQGWLGLLRTFSPVISAFTHPPHYWYVSVILILHPAISLVLGVGLLRRTNIIRFCAIAWFALHITGALGNIATHGFAGSVFAYWPPIPSSATVQYIIFGFIRVSYPLYYAFMLFSGAMNFVGLFLLLRPSIRNLFRPARA